MKSYITWNDLLDVTIIPFMYHCDICKNLIEIKSCKSIRTNDKNYYIHNNHLAIENADWIHSINKELMNGKEAT